MEDSSCFHSAALLQLHASRSTVEAHTTASSCCCPGSCKCTHQSPLQPVLNSEAYRWSSVHRLIDSSCCGRCRKADGSSNPLITFSSVRLVSTATAGISLSGSDGYIPRLTDWRLVSPARARAATMMPAPSAVLIARSSLVKQRPGSCCMIRWAALLLLQRATDCSSNPGAVQAACCKAFAIGHVLCGTIDTSIYRHRSNPAFLCSHETKSGRSLSPMYVAAIVPFMQACTASATDLEVHNSLHTRAVSWVKLWCCRASAKPGAIILYSHATLCKNADAMMLAVSCR